MQLFWQNFCQLRDLSSIRQNCIFSTGESSHDDFNWELGSQSYLEGDFKDAGASSGTTLNPRVVLLEMVIGGDDDNSGDGDCDIGCDQSLKRMKERVKAPIWYILICVPSNVGEFDEPFLRYILSDFWHYKAEKLTLMKLCTLGQRLQSSSAPVK